MTGNGKRWIAAATVLAFAALGIGAGVRLSTADEPKAAELADLRDAVTAASKRGDNVDDIAKSLDALDKFLAKGFKPEAGKKTDPPAELMTLRSAVEAAARKGENVDDIRKQLEAVEMKLVGRVLVAPKPAPPPLGDPPPARPEFPNRRFPNDFPAFPAFPAPDLNRNFGGGIDRDALQKSMTLRMKALEALMKDPNDPKALEMAQEATQEMLKAMQGGRGGIMMPDLLLPELGGGFARAGDRFRLGIRMEKLTPIVVDQLGLEAGRGIAITDVIADSAAAKAGFKPHDIVLEFAGKPVSDQPEEFNRQVAAVKAGEKVDAVVLRKGKKVELKGIELPAGDREIARPARRIPQPRFDVKPLPLPNLLPDLAPRAGGGNGLSATITNGNFTIKSVQDGVTYSLQGTTENGTPKLGEVTIEADGKVTKADSLDKVPAEYRPAVEKLLKTIGGRGPEVQLRPKAKTKD
jgi:serine protease Do